MVKKGFGDDVWSRLRKTPFGSLPKRELELLLLRSAIDAGLVKETPFDLASNLSVSVSRAHGYLNDLALREVPMNDKQAMLKLSEHLKKAEVISSDKLIAIPLTDSALRIWIERKLTAENLVQGESIRRDLVKLTPMGLSKILDSSKDILSPQQALQKLGKDLPDVEWIKQSKNHWTAKTNWSDLTGLSLNAGNFLVGLTSLLSCFYPAVH